MILLGIAASVAGAMIVGAIWGCISGYRSAKQILREHDHECTLDCLEEK